MSEADLQYIFFSYFIGIGPVTFDKLIKHFGSLDTLYHAKLQELKVVLRESVAHELNDFRKKFHPEKEYESLKKKNITVVTREHSSYPSQFKHLSDPPICLYVKGDFNKYNYERDKYFAIVGTRTPTDYGKQVAHKFASELSQAGFVIVSGLASGIDTVAHKAALSSGGRTIAFLGCGVDIVYPPSNLHLYDEILSHGGLIISEVPPMMRVMKGLFVQRNRLISGLSQGVLVAEGLKDSGSLITAKCALEQGKDVFAPPAPITSAQSAAPNLLLKEGAKMVLGIEDIFEEFNMSVTPATTASVLTLLNPQEKDIYTLLASEPYTSDELARSLHIPISTVLMSISGMELKGVIVKGSAGKYLLT